MNGEGRRMKGEGPLKGEWRRMKGEGEPVIRGEAETAEDSGTSPSPFALRPSEALRPSTTAICPLCSTDFEAEGCHASCPMARGCRMTRCPRCGFEFVGEGFIAGLLKKLVGRVSLSVVRSPLSVGRDGGRE